MAATHILVRQPRTELLWTIARRSALAATVGLLAWLVVDPDRALDALWYVAIPVLPATFFLNPVLWRGVCPLATFNELGNVAGRQRALSPRAAMVLAVAGVVLFHLMVPARRFLFNVNGMVLAGTVLGVALLALVLGSVYSVRSAFCNALCPVLPVELLYGQRPLLAMNRGRCTACTVCSPRGCIDLAQGKVLHQVLGPARRDWRWLASPFGFFAISLPGFIVGYSLTPDGPMGSAGVVYAATIGASLVSAAVLGVTILTLRLSSSVALPLLGALAGLLYYWFAGPAIRQALDLQAWTAWAIRIAGMGLVAYWLVAALRNGSARRGSGNQVVDIARV